MTPKERALAAAKAMWSNDAASQWLGMSIVDVDEGLAVLELLVGEQHCNGHGTCHGGISFSLADSAFAFACNSRNQRAVAQHNMITYVAAGSVGDRLRAEAREVSVSGRNGIYDVRVTNQDDKLIAELRGFSRAVKGTLFEEDTGA